VDHVQVRLLGPIAVIVGGTIQPIAGLRRKAALAVLALNAGKVVTVERLIDIVWADDPPATARNTLQRHVSYLRHALGSRDSIRARGPGYVLDIGAEATDVEAAERLIQHGERSADPARRAAYLRNALVLWHGPPLADVESLSWLDAQAERLRRTRLTALLALGEARLALGEHVQLIPELENQAQQHPFEEPIHGQLMLALYRAGRQADALATYQRLRRRLDEDLGIDPCAMLRELEAAILRQDRSLDPAPTTRTVGSAPAVGSVPAQLPLAAKTFTGRIDELARLDGLIAAAGPPNGSTPAAVVISAVSGTAGVGKTALAVHWAHRVAAQFPDGQLYANLRGFDPCGQVMDPAVAVRGFLDAFGVAVERIPGDLDAQAGLYRSVLAGKRVLVVLDNARDVEQVRPLLPGSPGCVVVVTSRNQLTPLVATEGAHSMTLDLLTAAEARDLLVRRLGSARLAGDPDAVEEIITRCARLPLALAIAAARAATSGFPLAALAAELRDAQRGLDALSAGDPATDVRAVFSWSYDTLSDDAARLFRLLGLHPGPDISPATAASLAGAPVCRVRTLLAELTQAHLITEPAPGRYTIHDLLRAYATEQSNTYDPEADRNAAIQRILDHYLHTAHGATHLLDPHQEPITVNPHQPGVTPQNFLDHRQALAWFTAEHPNLLATLITATGLGFESRTGQLARTLRTFLDRRGHWQDLAITQRAALDSARHLADRGEQALAHRSLARALTRLGRCEEADTHLQRALDLGAELSDYAGQAHTHISFGILVEQQGRHQDALGHTQQALHLFRIAGDRAGQATALNAVGWDHGQLGDHRQALVYCRQALALHQDLGNRHGEAHTWDSLGFAHHHLGHHREATTCYRNAIGLFRQLGDRYYQADTLAHLGDTHHAAGDPTSAHTAWQRALAILDDLRHPDADSIRTKMADADLPDASCDQHAGRSRRVRAKGAA